MADRGPLSPFIEVISAYRAGEIIIMRDDEARENEGDLVVATDKVTAEALSFMMKHGRGLICASIPVEVAERLNLPLQAINNNSAFQTPFAVSVDHRDVAGGGVTAAARALTMRKLLDPSSQPEDFISPGHVFPLIAHPFGVIGRAGQTEGSYDLARIAGLTPSGVICEILNPDGSMARDLELHEFASRHALKITSVSEVMRYRVQQEILVRASTQAELETDFGLFETHVFIDDVDAKEHLVLVYGREQLGGRLPLVRIHSECLTGDVFASRRCDCGEQLSLAMQRIVQEGSGIVLYLRQEGRGIGLSNKVRAYALQDEGHDTVEANTKLGFAPDQRDFAVAAKILSQFGVQKIRLMTNNPGKLNQLSRFGIEVVERMPLLITPNEYSRAYLEAKRTRLGHLL